MECLLEKAFDVSYDKVPFLCDLKYEPTIVYADWCGICGHKFDNQTDKFCPDCGTEREKLG